MGRSFGLYFQVLSSSLPSVSNDPANLIYRHLITFLISTNRIISNDTRHYIIPSNIQRHHYSGDLKKLMNDLLLAPTEEEVDMILDRILEIGGTNLQGKLKFYCIIFLVLLITFVI